MELQAHSRHGWNPKKGDSGTNWAHLSESIFLFCTYKRKIICINMTLNSWMKKRNDSCQHTTVIEYLKKNHAASHGEHLQTQTFDGWNQANQLKLRTPLLFGWVSCEIAISWPKKTVKKQFKGYQNPTRVSWDRYNWNLNSIIISSHVLQMHQNCPALFDNNLTWAPPWFPDHRRTSCWFLVEVCGKNWWQTEEINTLRTAWYCSFWIFFYY